MSDRYKIQINYRSGQSVVAECESFQVSVNKMNGARSYEWENMTPKPLKFGADDIESIWQL